jgi:glycosyltransferase involved in cell wall biosynthesis
MLSIITPVFNGEAHIRTCISNIINQNCPDMEHIIVDGGSGDKTVDIIKSFASQYPHIRWVSEKDNGQSDAMNKGILLAKGEIIGFLNADDFYEQGTLNRITEIFRGLEEPSLLVGNCNVWGMEGELLYTNRPSRLTVFDLVSGRPYPVNPSAYFYHKSLHLRTGYYDIDDTHAMDLDFLLRAVKYANVEFIDSPFGNFRMVKGSKTQKETEQDLAFNRMKRVLTRYRKDLPVYQRILARTNFFIIEAGRLGLNILRRLHIGTKPLTDMINH